MSEGTFRDRAIAAGRAEREQEHAEAQARAATEAQHAARALAQSSEETAAAMAALFGIADIGEAKHGQYPIRYAGLCWRDPRGETAWLPLGEGSRYIQSPPWRSVAVAIPCAECETGEVDSLNAAHRLTDIGRLLLRYRDRVRDEGARACVCGSCVDAAYNAERVRRADAAEAAEAAAPALAEAAPRPPVAQAEAESDEPGPLIYHNYVEIAPDTWVRADHVTLVEPVLADDPEHGSGMYGRVWVAGTERWSSPYTPAQLLKAIARLSAWRKECP